jgi:uncharacterized membrane protein
LPGNSLAERDAAVRTDSNAVAEVVPQDKANVANKPSVPAHQVIHQQISTRLQYSGPLPPPVILEGYDKLVPGSAKQILDDAHRQTSHRIAIERTVITSDVRKSYLGLAAGWTTAIYGLTWAGMLVLQGHPIAGTVLGGADLVALVSVFVYGTMSRRKERLEKAKVMTAEPPSQLRSQEESA